MDAEGRLRELRARAKDCRDPAAEDDTLALLLALARLRGARSILEIGTAEGLTSVALLLACPGAAVTTVEAEEDRWLRARENFADFAVTDRVRALLGDAADVLPALPGPYDLIFLDGPKAQYVNYLPEIKRLLAPRGLLYADDVLLYGWVNGREKTPRKRRSIVRKLREFLAAAGADEDFEMRVFEVGEGAALCSASGFSAEENALLEGTGAEIPLSACFPAEEDEE